MTKLQEQSTKCNRISHENQPKPKREDEGKVPMTNYDNDIN